MDRLLVSWLSLIDNSPKKQQYRACTVSGMCHWHKEINGPGIRRTDMDVTPRGSQFIDYDVPCDVLSTNGAILQHRPPSVQAWIRQPVAVKETEPTILMGGYCASVARTFAPADKQTKYGSSMSSRNIYNLLTTARESKLKVLY